MHIVLCLGFISAGTNGMGNIPATSSTYHLPGALGALPAVSSSGGTPGLVPPPPLPTNVSSSGLIACGTGPIQVPLPSVSPCNNMGSSSGSSAYNDSQERCPTPSSNLPACSSSSSGSSSSSTLTGQQLIGVSHTLALPRSSSNLLSSLAPSFPSRLTGSTCDGDYSNHGKGLQLICIWD